MSDWEKGECFLCGGAADKHIFCDSRIVDSTVRSRGIKYDHCKGGCPSYAIPGDILEKLNIVQVKKDELRKLSALLKQQERSDNFILITERLVEQATGIKLSSDIK